MRTKFDHPDTAAGHDGTSQKPYPSWNEMVSQLNRDRLGHPPSQVSTPQAREWHDLVAEMILRR